MKKIFIVSLAAISLVSCTHDYECACTVTTTSSSGIQVSTENTTLIGVTKAQMESDQACISYEQTTSSSFGSAQTVDHDCSVTQK